MLATLRPPSLRLRERRLNMRLMAHWQGQRDGRRFASWRDIDRTEIEDIWPDCFVIAVADQTSPTFHYVGETIARSSGLASGVDGGTPPVSAVPSETLLGAALRQLGTLFSDKTVVTDGGVFQDAVQAEFLFRSILLPLSDDQQAINFVIGGARCKDLTKVPGGS